MIDSIIKVLNKLKAHIDKYNIICKYYKEKKYQYDFLILFNTLSEKCCKGISK